MTPPMRIYSGIQPTAVMTIGNYFGAVRNWVRLQDEGDCVYCVVDLHAMTAPYDPAELRRSSREMFVGLLAAGIDPERTTLYIQSTVPEQSELCWLLATLTSLGDLSRMTQFKEKSGLLRGGLEEEDDGSFVSAGLLFYPVLQAADILAYRADRVPVGQDQSQHLELSRGIARRFNSRFGRLFPEPETLHTPVAKVLSTADPTRKMSKSLGPRHYIGLFEEADSIRRKIRSAVTDSGVVPSAERRAENDDGRRASPGIENLLALLAGCGHEADALRMREDYFAGTLRYVDLKGSTADALVALTTEMRERRADVLRRETDLDGLIMAMGESARSMARETLALVREKMGAFPPAI